MENFIKKYANSIICYPSGLTYDQLEESKIQKMTIVEKNLASNNHSYNNENKEKFLNEIATHIKQN